MLAGGKRVIISIPASRLEHALITTNPVEGTEQSHDGDAEANARDAEEEYQPALSRQKTVPLPRLEVPEDAADTSHNGTRLQKQQA